MAVDFLDPTQIDAAVGDAFGMKKKPTPAPAAAPTTPAPIRTNNPGALMPGGKLAEFGSMEEGLAALDKNLKGYKKRGINTLEGVISTWAPPNENDTKAYIAHVARVTGLDPKQQIDLDSPLVRQQLAAGIVQMESGRKAVFGHSGQTPGQISVDDLMKPEAVDAAVADAFGEKPKLKGVSGKVTQFLRGSAALADTLYGVVPGVAGMATYAGARAVGQSPEEAAATQAKVTSAIDKPFGKAFGVTETPEYKGEASQQLMNFIGENIGKGADWISEKTGVPKADVEYYMNLGMTAAPFSKTVRSEVGMAGKAAKQAGGKVVGAIADVTPAPVRNVVRGTTEAIFPGATKAPAKAPTLGVPGQPTVPGMPVPPQAVPPAGRASVGAAATPDATIVRQALQTATPEFQQLYGNMPLDKVNTPVVLRHLEADSLPIPMRLSEGMATQDPVLISTEMNRRGRIPEEARKFAELNNQLVENVPLIREKAAPDVYATKTIESSQALIDEYKALDKNRNAAIDAKFTELRDKAGGDLPVDSPTLLKNIDQQLSKELLLTDGQGISQYRELKTLADSGSMTFDQYLSMRRNLSRLSAEAKDGNVRQAARVMVQELDKLPLSNETAALKPIADEARGLARERFEALKKDPAYKAAVSDSVPADKFFNKFVINGVNKNINTMIDTLGRDSLGHQHIKAGTINYLSDKAGIIDGKGNFSQANYNKNLKHLDDVNNLEAIFDPESQLQLRTLGNVAAYTQFQPRGSFVNNSNTLVGFMANQAEKAGNVVGLGKFGIPAGTIVRQKIQKVKEKKEFEKSWKPGAGSTLDEISKKGK